MSVLNAVADGVRAAAARTAGLNVVGTGISDANGLLAHVPRGLRLLRLTGADYLAIGGVSHNPTEDTRPDDLVAGANVLLRTIVSFDNTA